ncbi:iron-siderophore ABC transporter substrate-binding protein, partial [Saccharothrix sp. MB29]|nr:iron-siderophore ABC transporter substrate-binding protein [Saccharothrix sp. MB29]
MRLLTPALVTAAVLLSACGTTETPAESTPTASAGGPVTVTDARGKAVELEAPAVKVVALEWAEAEVAAS